MLIQRRPSHSRIKFGKVLHHHYMHNSEIKYECADMPQAMNKV
jgi:hypothetical protein